MVIMLKYMNCEGFYINLKRGIIYVLEKLPKIIKVTAGIDGIKSLSPSQRYELSTNINDNIERHWSPVRQVKIPKKNGKTRILGIPTI